MHAAPISDDLARAIPKAEVHVHLEGGFDLVDLLVLAKEAGESLPAPARTIFDVTTHTDYERPDVTTGGSTAASRSGAGGGGLSGFLRFLDWQCGLVRTPEQAARHAYRFAARQTASGVWYTDTIINPTHWSAWRDRVPQLIAALSAGFDEAEQDGLAPVNIAVSVLRQQSAAQAAELAGWVARDRPARVVALSVDGDERTLARDGARFAEAFTIARDAGLGRTVHAGESSGPESMWDAIEHLHANRFDHGIRAIEDPALVARLVEDGIPLGVCPRSNIALGVVDSWAQHPVIALRDAGVIVSLNTDDPGPLQSRLESDIALTARELGLGLDDIVQFARNSVTASFAPAETKADISAAIETFSAA